MKTILTITFLVILTGSAEPIKGVALANGVSPDQKYEVVLEADKGSPRFDAYEFKGGDDEFPVFLIREIKSDKVLTRVSWEGDAHSDAQPLSSKSVVSWNPAGTAVILNTSERNYSHSSIWALDKTTGGFKELVLPDYKMMTGYEVPSSDDQRPRAHASAAWTQDGDLDYKIILNPLHFKEGGDPFRHKIRLKIGPKGFEIIKREILEE